MTSHFGQKTSRWELKLILNKLNSQGHNALPRPGLEPGSSDSEPSALTTGQSRGVGVPAVQLTTHVKSSTLYGRTSKFFPLDGLLLFFIIMGLRSSDKAQSLVKLLNC